MKKLLAIFVCSALLAVGPCTLESMSLAVDPGFGDRDAFVGVEFDFGDLDFVVPLAPLGS